MTGLLAGARRERLEDGRTLRLLSALETLEARREAEGLARGDRERALCSNACLLARALERDGKAVFADGEAALRGMAAAEIGALAGRWRAFSRRENPSPEDGEDRVEKLRRELGSDQYERLQWRVLRAFGALPTEARAREMTDREYLWCALNLLLDGEELLDRLCPACRAEAGEGRCPACGASVSAGEAGENAAFDRARFEALARGEAE